MESHDILGDQRVAQRYFNESFTNFKYFILTLNWRQPIEANKQTRGFILVTVDVEDWFQVENLRQSFPQQSWTSSELRVEKNVHYFLDFFDSAPLQASQVAASEGPGRNGNAIDLTASRPFRATFFVLGWIAERLPHLIREIHQRGHEVASHGYNHQLCGQLSCLELQKDIRDSKALLEDIIGVRVCGYRAPSFSVSDELLWLLDACGYDYDSSYNSFRLNRRHGKLGCSLSPGFGIAARHLSGLFELPISNLRLGPMIMPAGGGAYFRMIPFFIFRSLVNLILRDKGAYVFYVPPWEVDLDHPPVKNLSPLSK